MSKHFSMAGPPNNIPLRAKGYLESGIGLSQFKGIRESEELLKLSE